MTEIAGTADRKLLAKFIARLGPGQPRADRGGMATTQWGMTMHQKLPRITAACVVGELVGLACKSCEANHGGATAP